MPSNPYNGRDGSLSHALALDWAWLYVIRPSKASAVTLLDHDVFPTHDVSLDALLGDTWASGVHEMRGQRWYLWPGLLSLRVELVDRPGLSFRPVMGLDTGGRLWDDLFATLDDRHVRLIPRRRVAVRGGDAWQHTDIELIDDSWVHLVDGSGWFAGSPKLESLAQSSDKPWRLLSDAIDRSDGIGER
jgi:hypothetical protein